MLEKRKVISEIQNYLAHALAQELEALEKTPDSPNTKINELKQALLMYKHLPIREYTAEDVICPGTLVRLKLNQSAAYYLLVPKGGGLVTRVEGHPVQVITPQSPLGEVLLGKKVGDQVQLRTSGSAREYRVVEIS